MDKFEQAVKKIGGRFKVIAIIHKRMRELIESGVLKEKGLTNLSDSLQDKILDEILSGQIYVEENTKAEK